MELVLRLFELKHQHEYQLPPLLLSKLRRQTSTPVLVGFIYCSWQLLFKPPSSLPCQWSSSLIWGSYIYIDTTKKVGPSGLLEERKLGWLLVYICTIAIFTSDFFFISGYWFNTATTGYDCRFNYWLVYWLCYSVCSCRCYWCH